MIHTKEPVNCFTVYLTAYRSHYTSDVNEVFTKGLASKIRKFAGTYGSLKSEAVEGCYKEAGNSEATVERTLQVFCRTEKQVAELTWLACHDYDQDAVLVVNSQTHTASLCSIKYEGEYPLRFPVLKEDIIGVFTERDTGAEHYSIVDGVRWEVK